MTGRSAVDAYVAKLTPKRRSEVRALRTLIRGAAPGISEEVKWNAPSFRTVENFATMHLRDPKRISVILHLGARGKASKGFRETIPDPDGMLRWLGPDRAIVSFEGVSEIGERKGALTKIVRAWVKQVKTNGAGGGERGGRKSKG